MILPVGNEVLLASVVSRIIASQTHFCSSFQYLWICYLTWQKTNETKNKKSFVDEIIKDFDMGNLSWAIQVGQS